MNVARLPLYLSLCAILAAAPLALGQADGRGPATAPADGGGRGFGGGRGPAAPADVSAENIQTLHGFKVEVVLKADREKNGSWISMAKDSKGRLLLGGQRGHAFTRVTVDNSGKLEKEEVIKLPVSEAMGILEVGDALYVNGSAPRQGPPSTQPARGGGRGPAEVFGLYRLRDPKGDNSYSSIELLREWTRGSGEHGAHAILLAPDKRHLIVMNGNQVPPPADALPSSPHKNYRDDRAIPRQEDTFMANEPPPGSYIVRMDLDGKNPEVIAGGNRNTYDIAISADGEIFGYDSDMEWDWGTPWYRPTRVFHATSGADHGYRGGSGKYPTYYEDSLPATVNIGIGSPTGVVFGYGAKFPAKYQKALYIMDWTYGRLIAVHLRPQGASYEATWENFAAPKSLHLARKVPLNVTDMVIGNDGAMYFTIGGRNTQACLYRISYTGNESTAAADAHDKDGAEARELRRKLEAFHGKQDPSAVAFAWPHLSSDDRFLRFAARVAIENQPVAQWKDKALSETNPQAAIEALLALARVGGKDANSDVVAGLDKLPLLSLNEDLQLQKLRVLQVAIARNGKPTVDLAESIITELDPLYPSYSPQLNNELSQILLALNAPNALAKTVRIAQTAQTVEEQIAALMYMRHIKIGWTMDLRKEYFAWFNGDRSMARHPDYLTRWFDEAGRAYNNGNSFNGFIGRIRTEALATLTPDESASGDLSTIISAYRPPARGGRRGGGGRGAPVPTTAPATAPSIAAVIDTEMAAIPIARTFIRAWEMAELEPALEQVSSGRNYQSGQSAYVAAQCAVCHAMAGTPASGGVGPDLTSIASRFRRRDILEALIEPSKVLSEQFADTLLRLNNQTIIAGRVLEDADDKVVLQPNPLAPDKVEVKKADIAQRSLSRTSPMPTGLVNVLNRNEILDLIAYLEAGGRSDHPDFAR